MLGLYGGDDARVNATIEPAAAEMKKLGKTYEHEIYDGAGHGFVGSQADRDGANYRATEKAWPRALAFLAQHVGIDAHHRKARDSRLQPGDQKTTNDSAR